jgi:hypothetical protein
MKRFPAPSDRALLLSTLACAVVTVGVPAAILAFVGSDLPAGVGVVVAVALLAIPATMPVAWALAPRAFSVDARALRIERHVGATAVPLERIRSVTVLGDGALAGAVRAFGVAGAFGYYGRYWSRALGGTFRLYARRRRGPLVLVATDTDRLVLAPSDADGLVAAIQARAPHVRLLPHAVADDATPRPTRKGLWVAVVPVLFVPLVLLPTLFCVSQSQAPVAIDLRDDAVHIARRRAAPVDLPLSRVTRVTPVAPVDMRGFRRVAGTAYGDVAFGVFHSGGLGRFQLYAYRRSGYVLLEGRDGRVVVTPDDPDRFVDEVRARLARRGPAAER